MGNIYFNCKNTRNFAAWGEEALLTVIRKVVNTFLLSFYFHGRFIEPYLLAKEKTGNLNITISSKKKYH